MIWKFAGRFMSSIDSMVSASLDEAAMDQMLERDPVLILSAARGHLMDRKFMYSGDTAAWERLSGMGRKEVAK